MTTPGRSTLTATVAPAGVFADRRLVDLRHRGGRDRLRQVDEVQADRPAQRPLDLGHRDGQREGRHPILQRLEIARDADADDVGPRRQELAELDPGRPEPRQCRGEAEAAGDAAPLDQPRCTDGQARAGPAAR